MELGDGAGWRANLAWGLLLIVLNVLFDALFDERHDELRPRESLFGSALANDGLARSVERLDSLSTHNRFPVCYSSESAVVA